MASNYYNRAVKEGADGTWAYLTSTIKMMLVGTATPYTPNVDHDFVDMGGANDPADAEISVSGYTPGFGGAGRKTLASKTITEVDASDRAEFSSAANVWTALGTGATIAAGILITEIGVADTTARLIAYIDVTDTPTNGGDITVTPGTGGWYYGTTV